MEFSNKKNTDRHIEIATVCNDMHPALRCMAMHGYDLYGHVTSLVESGLEDWSRIH